MKNRADHVDNLLTEDDQWRKLKLVVDTAGKVWGGPKPTSTPGSRAARSQDPICSPDAAASVAHLRKRVA